MDNQKMNTRELTDEELEMVSVGYLNGVCDWGQSMSNSDFCPNAGCGHWVEMANASGTNKVWGCELFSRFR